MVEATESIKDATIEAEEIEVPQAAPEAEDAEAELEAAAAAAVAMSQEDQSEEAKENIVPEQVEVAEPESQPKSDKTEIIGLQEEADPVAEAQEDDDEDEEDLEMLDMLCDGVEADDAADKRKQLISEKNRMMDEKLNKIKEEKQMKKI